MIKVVVIDDEKWLRSLIIKLLPYDRYPITVAGEAEDGLEGLDLIGRVKPDVFLTDIRMPHLTGLDLIKKLNRQSPRAQIIIVSGYNKFDYAQTAIKYGVVGFILKPVESTELEMAFKRALDKMKKEEKLTSTRRLEKQVQRLSHDFIKPMKDEYPHIENDKIRKSLIYIDQNFQKAISLNDISDAVFMNSSYFSEMFKKEVGMGFNQYLINIRFKAAKKLLREQKDLSIGDISTIVGFTDSNYFSRLFKKSFGHTPQDFRNEPT